MKTEPELLIELFEKNGYSLQELGFATGASEAEINNIELVTQQAIPDELKVFLSYINGQLTHDFYFLPEQVRLLSCQEIITEWQEEQKYAEDTEPFYYEFHFEDKIRSTIYHKSRIPFAVQEGAGILYVDNDPGPNGQQGQIIFLITECDFIVLANSFREFIRFYTDSIQMGLLKFEKEKAGYPNRFRLKSDAEEMDGRAFLAVFRTLYNR